MTYKYMCSEPGQQLIHQKIKEIGLDAVVVAACSPHMHLRTFRKAVELAGVNPFLVEVANIRERGKVRQNRRRWVTVFSQYDCKSRLRLV